ncbi:hypothetical protein J1605_016913 [Eschrichtius robustus]|uniref:Lymphocyte cytosolic protein 2 n=1 Tax=Eschrichtius robustus TaxID=9764 RepID=A0AB34I3V0_ESCRO|nr:hypothetical protein J1605_016913 [Eschrichtius robustus]
MGFLGPQLSLGECSQSKPRSPLLGYGGSRCFLGSGYSRKDIGSSRAFPEGTRELEELKTPPRSGFGVLCPWVQHPCSVGELRPRRATMAFRNVPFRSEVLAWDPDTLADYFKKLNYKDCEKAVKKHHIDGPRFLKSGEGIGVLRFQKVEEEEAMCLEAVSVRKNLAENDIQKFPKLRVPILSKLSQEINKNEERRSIFTRKPQVQRFPEETESHEEDNGGWSSFEDDYESPDDDQDGEDDGDYESPNEEEEAPVEDDADYEPPPSNDEEALQNSILPAKPFSNPSSTYIDRPHSGKVQQPPVPPQRPMAAILPLPAGGRAHSQPLPPPQPNHEEPSRSRNQKTAKLPAPSIDRSTKPPLDRSLAPFDREPFALGKKPAISDKLSAPAGRPLGEHLPKIQKPPLPPAMERHDRSSPLPGKKPPVPKHGWGSDRRENVSTKCHVVNAWHRETGVGSEEVEATSALPSLESSTGSQACTQ